MKISDRQKWFARLGGRLHIFLYRLTGGLIGGRMAGCPTLLLTSTGRKSGKQFTIPIFYVQDGDSYVIAASFLGSDEDPQWWKNLKATPECRVEVGRRRFAAVARQLDSTHKDALWPRFVAMYPGYDTYKGRTTRDIPLVALNPT